MSNDVPPNPLTDLRKGLGLLFRAARTTARKLPSTNLGKELEEAVVTSAREVGRAFENVASTIEREVLGKARSAFGRRDGSGPAKDGAGGEPENGAGASGAAPPKADEPRPPR